MAFLELPTLNLLSSGRDAHVKTVVAYQPTSPQQHPAMLTSTIHTNAHMLGLRTTKRRRKAHIRTQCYNAEPPETTPTTLEKDFFQPLVYRVQHALTTPWRRWQQRRNVEQRLKEKGGCVVEWYVPVMELEAGDCVLICGDGEALGRWNPVGAPVLSLEQEGDCWFYRTRIEEGIYKYKLVLIRADGSAAWEEGPFRELRVPNAEALISPPTIVLELNFNNTYIDNVTDYIQSQLASLEVK